MFHNTTDYDSSTIMDQAVCDSQEYFLWFLLLFGYQVAIMLVAVWLSIRASQAIPHSLKNFQTNGVVKLVYILLTLFAVGFPLYYITHVIIGNLLLEYSTVTLINIALLVFYLAFLFTPQLIAVPKKKFQLCK